MRAPVPAPRAGASLDTMSPAPPRELLDALAGMGVMGLAVVSPFLRSRRGHWGMDPALAARALPGDDLVPAPSWSWSHGIVVAARPEVVWPWVAQIGADRAGFYSYAALENLVGCNVRNAERIHPEWQEREGTTLVLHPKAPPLSIVEARPGGHLVAFGPPDEEARVAGRPWVAASWLLMVAPLGAGSSRVISRYRVAHSGDRRTRLAFGPALLEPIGFAMDRRMLIGIRDRAERAPAATTREVAA